MRGRLVVIVFFAAAAVCVNATQHRPADVRVAESRPGSCEANSADLDDIRNEALEGAGKDGIIIAIARLGNKEVSRTHNLRRLLAVRNYLVKHGVAVKRIVIAEGEKVKGYGRVELYAEGKLRAVLLAHPNKALCVECCDPKDEDFYPYRKSK